MADRTPDDDATEIASEAPEPAQDDATEAFVGDAAPPRASTAAERRFDAGTKLTDRYRVVRRLGKGGMGEVYLADDLKLHQQVALKFLPPEMETDEDRRQLLFDEVKVALKISHPNCCRVFDLGEADGVHFLSMEYIDGEDLSSLLGRIGRLPWEKAVELGKQACEGLAAAHDAGILHRDLKPANLMIDGQGRAKITDFGLAALSDGISGAAIRSGTPAYMAPEQLVGTEVTVQSDIYALGLLLYELFTGRRAFEASSLGELINMHQKVAPKPPSAWVEGIDPAIERVLLQCLEKDPKARPASAREVAEGLARQKGVAEGARISTLLLSDLVGSSAMLERSGDTASAELSRKHERLARDLLEEHGGREIDKTDGFLMLFDRPWQAVLYALDYHRVLAELSEAEGVELASRVGIHLGEIVLRRNPPQDVARGAKPLEVEGLAKPTAARLMSVAGGRQTLMTQAAFDLARRSAIGSAEGAESLQWLAHGSYLFKGVEEPVEVFEVGVEGVAPLAAPESSEKVTRVADEETILGWRPAPGLEIPYRRNWVVKEKLGEGGFGEVWLGEHQKTGDERVFKFCYDAERLNSLQREITVFRLLKEEIGLRDDIARILDWNLEEAPYFVEFVHVEGGNLVDWAQGKGGIGEVPLADRLEIVAQAATALSAAHSVGVLHKDIKPANILMTRDAEGKPQAVLTDFGIGLVTDEARLASKGITVLGLTEMDGSADGASTVGTQIYMAPELLAGKPSTTQVDIYALGVMLYQVAVGELDRPLAQGWERHIDDEILREDIAACVEGTPSRRPGNASEVAERLRTLEERRATRKAEKEAAAAAERSLRRRKVLATVAAVSSVFLIVVTFLAIQAMRARGEAERRRGQAEQLIDFMLNDLHEGLERIGRLDLLESVAHGSQQYFDALSVEDEGAGDIDRRGVTLLHIGDVLLGQGDSEAAAGAYGAALDLYGAAAAREPASTRWQAGQILAESKTGSVQKTQGQSEAALSTYRSALESSRALLDAEPDNPEYRFIVAEIYYRIAELNAQMRASEEALEAGYESLRLAKELTARESGVHWRHRLLELDANLLIGRQHRRRRIELAEALEALNEAEGLAREQTLEDPGNSFWLRRLASIQKQIGTVRAVQGRRAEALRAYEAAAKSFESLIATDPTRVEWAAQLAVTRQLIGYQHFLLGDRERALEFFRDSSAGYDELLKKEPERAEWIDAAARTHQSAGTVHLENGDLDKGLESFETSQELLRLITETSEGDPGPLNALSWGHVELGRILLRQGRSEQARQEWTRAVELIEPVTAEYRELSFFDTHAQALLLLDRIEEARPLVQELLDADWDDAGFLKLIREKGLAPGS